jgi:hypothetical protein
MVRDTSFTRKSVKRPVYLQNAEKKSQSKIQIRLQVYVLPSQKNILIINGQKV